MHLLSQRWLRECNLCVVFSRLERNYKIHNRKKLCLNNVNSWIRGLSRVKWVIQLKAFISIHIHMMLNNSVLLLTGNSTSFPKLSDHSDQLDVNVRLWLTDWNVYFSPTIVLFFSRFDFSFCFSKVYSM